MSYQPVTSNSSLAGITNQLNNLARDVQSTHEVQIFKDDTGTRRVLLGRGADGFYGLKVSKAGFDVYTASDDELSYNSSQNTLKVVLDGTATVVKPANDSSAFTDVAHGLSTRPAVLAYALFESDTIYEQVPTSFYRLSGADAGKLELGLYTQVDDTYVSFFVEAPNYASNTEYTDQVTYNFKYYLLQETAN